MVSGEWGKVFSPWSLVGESGEWGKVFSLWSLILLILLIMSKN